MYEKLKEIYTVLILAAILLVILEVTGSGKTGKTLAMTIPKSIGMKSELKEQIDSLELDIARRINYDIEISRDPLKLNNILQVKGFNGNKEFKERQQALRLSCTILSPKASKAVIKHRSKSYVLAKGDKIAGYTVKGIEKKRVVLSKDGKESILVNRPAPKAEKIRDKQKSEKEIKL